VLCDTLCFVGAAQVLTFNRTETNNRTETQDQTDEQTG